MATGPDDVRFQGKTGSSRPTTKMTRLTPLGHRRRLTVEQGSCPPAPPSCTTDGDGRGIVRAQLFDGAREFIAG